MSLKNFISGIQSTVENSIDQVMNPMDNFVEDAFSVNIDSVSAIIKTAKIACGSAGALTAQIPGFDILIEERIQIKMIKEIATFYRFQLSDEQIYQLFDDALAHLDNPSTLEQILTSIPTKRMPYVGNLLNAREMWQRTEVIGWIVNQRFLATIHQTR